MLVVHSVTHFFPPEHGGLATWMAKFAHMIAGIGHQSITYVCDPKNQHDYEQFARTQDIAVRLVGRKPIWADPIMLSPTAEPHLLRSLWQLDCLALRAAVKREIDRLPFASHVILSAYAVREGFLGSIVAEDLEVPHIAVIVGSDFSRGYRNPPERDLVSGVAARSRAVVTFSREQERILSRDLGARKCRTIHTSVDSRVLNYHWQGCSGEEIKLFSNSGYSFKKGTLALMEAFAALRHEGLPVSLRVCGDYFPGEEAYWEQKRVEYAERFGQAANLSLYQPQPGLWQEMAHYDIYCSPTLGEGCSHARIAALCMGMPIVTTVCGEMPDVADKIRHVCLSSPADFDMYREQLRDAVLRLLSGRLMIDSDAVEEWRRYFSPARETAEWAEFLSSFT